MKYIKYRPTLPAAIVFLLLLAMFALLFLGRHNAALQPRLLLRLIPDFYHHASNLCISYCVCAGAGYMGLMLGVKARGIVALCLTMAAVNFIFEVLVLIANTPDVVDAIYGTAGTSMAAIFLMLVRRYGLRPAAFDHTGGPAKSA